MRPQPQQKIDRRALTIWRMAGAMISLVTWALPVLYGLIFDEIDMRVMAGLIGIAVLATFFLAYLFPQLRWSRWRYEIHEQDIDLQYGIFIIRRVLIPMVRVQHVDTQQGPLMRMYGLASVTISTAAGTHEIPALRVETADQVRERIAELAKVADEIV